MDVRIQTLGPTSSGTGPGSESWVKRIRIQPRLPALQQFVKINENFVEWIIGPLEIDTRRRNTEKKISWEPNVIYID
jgi:hypothetical protein